jgi:inorganic pyrophosphatase
MNDFWSTIEQLIATSKIVIDRPRGTAHPHFSDLVYPLDYGYLKNTISGDGSSIDFWLGASGIFKLSGLLLTVDAFKRDAEIKLLLGCTQAEILMLIKWSNTGQMRAIYLTRNSNHEQETLPGASSQNT